MHMQTDQQAQAEITVPDAEKINASIQAFDFGESAIDRYTVVYMGAPIPRKPGQFMAVGMNAHPSHPMGFGQHVECAPGEHLGRSIRFQDLPPDCQRLVRRDLADIEAAYGDVAASDDRPRPAA